MASLVLGYSKKTQWKVQEMKAGHKKKQTYKCKTVKTTNGHKKGVS